MPDSGAEKGMGNSDGNTYSSQMLLGVIMSKQKKGSMEINIGTGKKNNSNLHDTIQTTIFWIACVLIIYILCSCIVSLR